MKALAFAFLALVALLTGGCSVLFLFASLFDSRPMESLSYIIGPALLGLLVCGLCILIMRAILRSPAAPPQADDTAPPRKDNWR